MRVNVRVANSVMSVNNNILRIMDAPFGVCSFKSPTQQLQIYKKICSGSVNLDKLIVDEQVHPLASVLYSREYERRREAMIDRDTQQLDSFKNGSRMIHKKLTETDNGSYEHNLPLLLLKNLDGPCYNLFSVKDTWNMEDILALLKGKNIIFFDYSCSQIPPSFNFTPELERGGKNKTKKHKKKIR